MTEELLKRVKNREKKAQYEFYRQFSACLFRLVYRYVKDEQDAGSIVNITFYKIFENINKFRYQDDVSMMAWMKKIAANEALMFLRQKILFTEFDDKAISESNFEVAMEDELALEDYYFLIRKLPDDLRTVFNLYAIEGFSHCDIANRLNITESSSRVYLSRARKMLQNFLTKN